MGKILLGALRQIICFLGSVAVVLLWALPAAAQPEESFDTFKERFEITAVAAGVDPTFYWSVMDSVTEDPEIAKRIDEQSGFATPIWDYISTHVTARRVVDGRAALAVYRPLFDRVSEEYGLDPYLLSAIWGMETNYAADHGSSHHFVPLVPELANVVYQRRPSVARDEAELIAALRIAQDQGFAPDELMGEWPGGIGHMQVLPSLVLALGQDGDGDGRVDVHNSLADALETAASFLQALGYEPGLDWGLEVTVPSGFDYESTGNLVFRPLQYFADRGVEPAEGREFLDPETEVALYTPAASGPKFLVTRNYDVLKEYAHSDAYALAVSFLADRIKGLGETVALEPREIVFPNEQQRFEIQEWLAALGYYEGEIDGLIGPLSRAAYAQFQADRGMVADGVVTTQSHALLQEAVREAGMLSATVVSANAEEQKEAEFR